MSEKYSIDKTMPRMEEPAPINSTMPDLLVKEACLRELRLKRLLDDVIAENGGVATDWPTFELCQRELRARRFRQVFVRTSWTAAACALLSLIAWFFMPARYVIETRPITVASSLPPLHRIFEDKGQFQQSVADGSTQPQRAATPYAPVETTTAAAVVIEKIGNSVTLTPVGTTSLSVEVYRVSENYLHRHARDSVPVMQSKICNLKSEILYMGNSPLVPRVAEETRIALTRFGIDDNASAPMIEKDDILEIAEDHLAIVGGRLVLTVDH